MPRRGTLGSALSALDSAVCTHRALSSTSLSSCSFQAVVATVGDGESQLSKLNAWTGNIVVRAPARRAERASADTSSGGRAQAAGRAEPTAEIHRRVSGEEGGRGARAASGALCASVPPLILLPHSEHAPGAEGGCGAAHILCSAVGAADRRYVACRRGRPPIELSLRAFACWTCSPFLTLTHPLLNAQESCACSGRAARCRW